MADKFRISPQAVGVITASMYPTEIADQINMDILDLEKDEDIVKLAEMMRRKTLDYFDDSGIRLCRDSFAYEITFNTNSLAVSVDNMGLPYTFPDDVESLLKKIWELLFDRGFPTSFDRNDYYSQSMDISDISKLYVKPWQPPVWYMRIG